MQSLMQSKISHACRSRISAAARPVLRSPIVSSRLTFGPITKRSVGLVKCVDGSAEPRQSEVPSKAKILAHVTTLMKSKEVVVCTLKDVTSGGLSVEYRGYDAFIPNSMLSPELSSQEAKDALEIGQEIPVRVTEFDERRSRIRFRHEKAPTFSELKVCDLRTGVVQSVKSYGVFVDIQDGIVGLLHAQEMSAHRPNESMVMNRFHVGEELKVLVHNIDQERQRVNLSTKELEPSPGDILNNPALVFEMAEEMAAAFHANKL